MRRWVRVLLGGGLVGLGAWTVVPGMIHPISTDAVLNAEVVTVRAPIEGVLAGAGFAIGDRVAAGETVARIKSFHSETARRDQAALDLAAGRRLAEALAGEVSELAALDRRLLRETAAYGTAATARLELSEAQSQARARAAEAVLARVRLDLARRRTLLDKGFVAPAAVEAAEADARSAQANVEAAQADARRVAAELKAARHGTFVGDGFNNVPYSRQRYDEVHLKLLQRRSDLAAARARQGEHAARLAAEEADLARLSDAAIVAPAGGVVWQRFAGDGDGVRPGDPVLGVVDCRALFLTAVLPKRFFPEIKAGDRAQARLQGDAEPVAAVVQSVRAGSGVQANASAAVTSSAEEGHDVVITLAIEASRLGTRSDNLCQVGQHATVTFAMPALTPFVNAVAGRLTRHHGLSS
jgi:multidrug resistance efflux pump